MDKTLASGDRRKGTKEKSFFVCVFTGTLMALGIGLVLLLIFALTSLSAKDPDRLAAPLALAAFFITAFLSGYLSSRSYGKSGLACGAVSGILLIGILVLAAFAMSYFIRPSLFAVCAPAAAVFAALSGICGAKGERQPKPRHKVKF